MDSTQQELLVKAIGRAVGTRRSEVEALLIRNGVIVPEGASDAQLIRIVFMAIADSKGFRADLSSVLEADNLNADGEEGNGIDWVKIMEATIKLGTSWANNRAARLAAEAEAEQAAILAAEQKAIKDAESNAPAKSGVNWMTIGIVTGVVALLGTTIYLVTRKK